MPPWDKIPDNYFELIASPHKHGSSLWKSFFQPHPRLVDRSALALGFFDGVHPGHQLVIKKAVEEAQRLGVKAGVVTFRDHPRGLIQGRSPLLLTVIEQRLDLFRSLGVDVALVLTFSEELCRLSPSEYVDQVLVEAMGTKSISVGHNHHFGRDREGNSQLLKQFGQVRDFVVHVASMVYVENLEVSSSRIRELINSKDLELANKLLSRPFTLRGAVVQGAKRGGVLGFPTANLLPAFNQLVPPVGVYVGTANIPGGNSYPAVINIGYRPTFASGSPDEAERAVTIEAHLLGYQGDLYGQVIGIGFLKFLRDEQKFDGLEALTNQIAQDCQVAACYLKECLALSEVQARPGK